jgi:hypothetical protein
MKSKDNDIRTDIEEDEENEKVTVWAHQERRGGRPSRMMTRRRTVGGQK